MTAKNVSSSESSTKQDGNIPAQSGSENNVVSEETNPELTLVEGGKNATKSIAEVVKNLLKNKKVMVSLGAAAVTATAVFLKYNKQVGNEDTAEVEETPAA